MSKRKAAALRRAELIRLAEENDRLDRIEIASAKVSSFLVRFTFNVILAIVFIVATINYYHL